MYILKKYGYNFSFLKLTLTVLSSTARFGHYFP